MGPELVTKEKKEVAQSSAERLVETGAAFIPDTDIMESTDELVFRLDLPGVTKGDVRIEVDENNVLTIQGKNSFKEPEEDPVLRQYDTGDYYRAFTLGEEFDKDKVSGKLENGVLEIRIPKREEAKPKRIHISI